MVFPITGGRDSPPPLYLFIQPALDLSAIPAKHGWFLVTLVETEGTARRETASGWQVNQAGRLASDKHRI